MQHRGLDELRRHVERLGDERRNGNLDPRADADELRERYELLGEIERLEHDHSEEGSPPPAADSPASSHAH